MKQSCKYCGRMHPFGAVCPNKPQPHRKNTEAQRFRNTGLWKRTRARVNARDGHLCRLCLREGKLEQNSLGTHHIIPLEESMAYATEDDWCITLCDPHHKAADLGEYGRAELHALACSPLSVSLREVQRAKMSAKGAQGVPPGGATDGGAGVPDTHHAPLQKKCAGNEKSGNRASGAGPRRG